MSVILGINAFHAGAAAAVIVDGVPVAAVAEERLNRVKYYAAFPALAIRQCLDMAGLDFGDIDHVAVGRDASANRAKKLEYVIRNPSKLLNLVKLKGSRSGLDDLRARIAEACGVSASKLRFDVHRVEHHLAHAASAYFCSPWERASGFTLDGSGDFVTCMFARCEGDRIDVVNRMYVPNSLGSLYTMVCEFIGYDRYGDEGKVMGLAPLGKDTYHDTFDEMVSLTRDGIRLNPEFFLPFGSDQGMTIDERGQMVVHRHHTERMVELFGRARKRHDPITRRDEDLAFGLQRRFEDGYMHLLNQLHAQVPGERVAMAGGCCLNSVANGKLFGATPFSETFIQPAAGDDGLAIGAALYVSNSVLREGKRWHMRDAYLGPEYSEAQMKAALDEAGIDCVRYDRDDLLDATVAHLQAGDVIGWFQGRAEWGPRALGNRSIITHPGLPDMKDVLNARIKHREPFRPFAPSVLEERQGEIFTETHPSPFMLHVYEIKPEWRERLCAVNHVDQTGRLQSVSHEENPLYHDLIKRFGDATGIPVILNTSFNENEPIVTEPREAIDCYARTKMDVLVLGPFVARKAGADKG